jgi:uncharacterized membrane protein YbhN (UPF0104 family)
VDDARRALLKRVFWSAFAVLVAWLLWRLIARTDWAAVLASVRTRSAWQLAAIVATALAGHAVYGLLDVVGRSLAGHRLPLWRTWLTATTCYALNLNLGGAVGGVGLRLRLYGTQGVPAARIGRVIAGSILANWVGYALLLASLPLWAADNDLARWTGATTATAISVAAAAVVAVAAWGSVRGWSPSLRGHEFPFPAPRPAAAMLLAALGNWLLMAAVLWLCLGDVATYGQALAALLVGAVASAVTHVPGGLGVLDAVLVTMLAGRASEPELVAAVLLYRAAYYLLPLALAGPTYALLTRGQGSAHAKGD